MGVWGVGSGIPEGAAGYSSSRKGCIGNVGIFASFKKATIWCTEKLNGGSGLWTPKI